SIIAVADVNGDLGGELSYSPYGEFMNYEEGPGTWSGSWYSYMGSLGVRFVGDRNLLHMNARYYNVRLKRFLTPDPIGLDGGFNLYLYANANPVFYVDPLGLCPQSQSSPPRTSYLEQRQFFGRQNAHDPGSISAVGTYEEYDRANVLTYGQMDPSTPQAKQQSEINAALLQMAISARFGPAPKVAASGQADDFISLYHQGNLIDDQVSATRALSTSRSTALTHYNPGAVLNEFQVPTKTYLQWLDDGLALPRTDLHAPSGIITSEIRIMPPASGALNGFLVSP
ncbi:MAG: RHS repeat-associated core domain-containing protein, partial [Verrucomicrobiae bacterium]|nr:RHS repeat-associated core domain-containing protein [Verrucomicrobiae bacterium]